MKKSFITFILALSLFIPNQLLAGIRCGNEIISRGDSTFKVQHTLKQCGEVLEKEVIETTVSGNYSYNPDTGTDTTNFQEERIKTERWWIQVENWGSYYCYPLIFEAGKLVKIEKWERCD